MEIPFIRPCYYCGDPANTVDHTTPQSLLAVLPYLEQDVYRAMRDRLPRMETVPACKECNSTLGDRIYPTMADRREALKMYLRKKYKRLLNTPDWVESELAELSYRLRQFVEQQQKRKAHIRRRLRWPNT